jgi:hypothetical protein
MTMRVSILIAGLLIVLGVCPTKSHAVTRISADISFYDELTPYGSWEHVSRYGDCWIPRHRAASWRPYTVGYWVDTDYGWMWISEDPWGGIPYHYGRWAYDAYYGWIWVPDDDLVWAPSWVSWRYNDDYVGWAPLPPDAGWGGSGLTINVTLLDRRTDRSGWCFAPIRTFGTTRVRYDILPSTRNVTLISQTRNVTRYETYNSYPVNRGISPDIVRRATGRQVPRYRLADASSGSLKNSRIQGRTIEVYRPRIAGARRDLPKFVPVGKGRPSRDTSQPQRVQQGREDVRTRQDRAATQRQRVQDRTRENETRRQQQSEMRIQQQRDAQRRQDQIQRQRGQSGNRGQGQDQRNRNQGQGDQGGGQGQPPPDKGQGNSRGRGQDQRGKDQGQDQGGKGKGQDQNDGKDQGQGQDQNQNQNDQDKNRGHGHGG